MTIMMKMQLKGFINGSKLAIGTWYMGDSIENEDQEIQAIRYAIDNGVNIIDTAQMYGDGNSERLVAKAIKPYKREDIFLVSKVLPQNSTRDKIFKACQQSLDRLEVDYLDLYLLHWKRIMIYLKLLDIWKN